MNTDIEHIICQYLSGETTTEEDRRVFEWINLSKENEQSFFEQIALWRMKSGLKDNNAKDLDYSLSRLNARIDKQKGNKNRTSFPGHTVILSLVCFIQAISISAQSVISGGITDKDSVPVADAAVLLLVNADSTYVAGTVSGSDGRFEFLNPVPDSYILSFSMLGFKNKYIPVTIENSNTRIILESNVLEEDPHALSEVVVTGRKEAIQLEAGKTTISVASTIFGTRGSVFDALKAMPGVFIEENGTIILNGQPGATVTVNGRLAFSSGENIVSILKSTPASSVDKIELITNPPVRYDASGKAGIINIKLRRDPFLGISGSFNTNYKYGRHGRGYSGGRFSFQADKLSVAADYSHYRGTSRNMLTIFREYKQESNPDQINQTIAQDNLTKYSDKNDFLRLNIDYDISEKITLGYHTYGIWNRRSMPSNNQAAFNLPEQATDSILLTTGISEIKQNTLSGGVYGEYKNDRGVEAGFSADYLFYDHKEDMRMDSRQVNISELLTIEDTLKGDLNGRIRMFSLQNDVTIPVSAQVTLEAGLKSAFINIDNSALYYNIINNSPGEYLPAGNKNSYHENINAAYAQMETKAGRFGFSLGLRIENTRTRGRYFPADLSLRDSSYYNNYTNLFPNIAGTYTFPDEKHTVSLQYNKRITRPNYRDLMPFNQIWDKYTMSQGNPELEAELTHNLELIYVYKKTYRATFFVLKINNAFSQNYLVREGGAIAVFPDNISSRFGYGLKFDTGNFLNLKWWQPSVNFLALRADSRWTESGSNKRNELFSFNLNLHNQLYFGKNWSAEISAFYNGRMIVAQTDTDPFGSVSVGIIKKIFRNQASLRLFAEDIFATLHDNLHIDFIDIKTRTTSVNDSRCFGLSFSYNFKKGKQNTKSLKDRSIDESKRINL